MRLPEIVSFISLILGGGLFFEWYQSMRAWEDYMYFDCCWVGNMPTEPGPFLLGGLLFITLSISCLIYDQMHPIDGRCPWCGQSIREEDVNE